MKQAARFCIVTPDGGLLRGAFVIAYLQPANAKRDFLLMVDPRDGRRVTVHRNRLMPLSSVAVVGATLPSRSACRRCGRVSGVVGEQVICPDHGVGPCATLDARFA